MANPSTDYGTRTLPGRPYRVFRAKRPEGAYPGGARGPVALPSRQATTDLPAPPDARSPLGASGPVTIRFGRVPGDPYNFDAPSQLWARLAFWSSVAWRRFWYRNDAGTKGYVPPTGLLSWSADSVGYPGKPTVGFVTFRKWVGTWSTKRDFHQDAIRFPIERQPQIITSATLKRMRDPRTNRMHAGKFDQQTRWNRAPSYGSLTPTLPTAPTTGEYGGEY